MSVSTIQETVANGVAYSGSAAPRMPKQTLGQQEFFKLISAQLAAQDPLKPMDDTSFIAQLANFSSLENTSQLVTQIKSLSSMQAVAGAQDLLGRTVSVADPDDSEQSITGMVTAVNSTQDGLFITVNGADYAVGSVRRVELNPATSTQD